MRRFSICAVFCLVGVTLIGSPLAAQDTSGAVDSTTNPQGSVPPTEADLSAAIAGKEAEIAKLKEQLEQAKGEIKNLHSQNEKLQSSDETLKTEIQTAGPGATPLRPSPAPLTAMPDISATVNSEDLFWYFHNSADSANQYLKGKRLKVIGKLVGFDSPLVIRVFGILLESGDPNLKVVCRFVIPSNYASVIFQRQTGTIFGQSVSGGLDPLLHLGDTITVEGKCQGAGNGDVVLNACRLIL